MDEMQKLFKEAEKSVSKPREPAQQTVINNNSTEQRAGGYINKNLMRNENIVYRANLHWIVFGWPIFWFIVMIALGAVLPLFIAVFIAITIITGIVALIRKMTSEFAITNKRVVIKVGWIRRTSLELLLNKIEGIQVSQGIFGRIFGYGSVIMSGTGGTKNPFHKISHPFEFKKRAQEQIALAQEVR